MTCNTTNTFINFAYYNDNLLKSQEEWGTASYGDGNHHTITYTYDGDANRTSAAMFGTATLGYTYTARDQLKAVTKDIGGANYVGYSYDPSGNALSRAPDNGTLSSFVYDALNRATSIIHTFAATTRTLNYAFDEVGNRKYVQRTGDSVGDDGFGYDFNNQMTSFYRNGTLSGGAVTTGTHTTLGLDAAGNRKTVTVGATTTTYGTANSLNQYPTIGGLGLTYGPNGNLLTYNGWTYGHDSINRLTSVGGSNNANFYYDGLNRQVARTIDGSTTYSVWDGASLYAEYATGNVLSERLVYGAGGRPSAKPVSGRLLLSRWAGEHGVSLRDRGHARGELHL